MKKTHIPVSIRLQNTLTLEEFIEKSWLLAAIAGDGHVRDYVKLGKNIVTICMGLDKALAEIAVEIANKLYYPKEKLWRVHETIIKKPRQNVWNAVVYQGAVVDDVLTISSHWDTGNWEVPEVIKNHQDSRVKAAFVSGMADTDGSVIYNLAKGVRAVNIDSTNIKGLEQVKQLLTDLGIVSYITNHDREIENHNIAYKLHITFHEDLKKFHQIVGFKSPTKQQLLSEAVSSYKKKYVRVVSKTHQYITVVRKLSKRRSEVRDAVTKIQEFLENGDLYDEIAQKLGDWTKEQVRYVVKKYSLTGPGRGHGVRYKEIEKWVGRIRELASQRKTCKQTIEILEKEGFKIKKSALYMLARSRGIIFDGKRVGNVEYLNGKNLSFTMNIGPEEAQ